MKKDPIPHIVHIIEMANIIEWLLEGFTKEKFIKDIRTSLAVLRALETMSDATQHLGEEIQSHYPHIHWRKIKGFRNVLAHEYLGDINYAKVWDVINLAVPVLKEAMLKELPDWEEFKLRKQKEKKNENT